MFTNYGRSISAGSEITSGKRNSYRNKEKRTKLVLISPFYEWNIILKQYQLKTLFFLRELEEAELDGLVV
jgi:hypothetical protein